MANLSKDDMIERMYAFQEEVTKPMFQDLKDGKLGVCVAHDKRIESVEKELKSKNDRNWGVTLALIAGCISFAFTVLKSAWPVLAGLLTTPR